MILQSSVLQLTRRPWLSSSLTSRHDLSLSVPTLSEHEEETLLRH